MRRADGSMNGVVEEFLIASAALHMKEEGAEVLSLSGAPLAAKPLAPGRAAGAHAADDAPARVPRQDPRAGLRAFSSPLQFKAKFNPDYETISMAYPDPLALPTIGIASGQGLPADCGEGGRRAGSNASTK